MIAQYLNKFVIIIVLLLNICIIKCDDDKSDTFNLKRFFPHNHVLVTTFTNSEEFAKSRVPLILINTKQEQSNNWTLNTLESKKVFELLNKEDALAQIYVGKQNAITEGNDNRPENEDLDVLYLNPIELYEQITTNKS